MKKNGRLVAIALGSVLCASCVGGAFLVAGSTPAAETVRAADADTKTVTYTIASKSSVNATGDIISGSSVSFANTYSNNKNQMTSGHSATLTLSKLGRVTITNLTLNMASNKSSGAGTLEVLVNDADSFQLASGNFSSSSWNGSFFSYNNGNFTPVSKDVNYAAVEDLTIAINCTSNSLYIESYSITYQPFEIPSYDHIKVDGALNKTEYFVGDSLSTDGLVVYGYLAEDDSNPTDITNLVDWEINPSVFTEVNSETNVEVLAYLGEELMSDVVTYTVNVKKAPVFTGLSIDSMPTKTTYKEGDRLDTSGLKLIASYDDGSEIDVTSEVSIESHTFSLQDVANGYYTIKLAYKGESVDLTFVVEPDYTISEFRDLGSGKSGIIAGTVTGMVKRYDNWNIYVNDGDRGLMLYNVSNSLARNVNVGKRIAIKGKLTVFNGLYEVSPVSDLAVGGDGEKISPIEVTEYSSASLEGLDGSLIHLSKLIYVTGTTLGGGDGAANIDFAYGDVTVTMRAPTDDAAVELADDLDQFLADTKGLEIDFTGHLGWFNGPQLSPTSIDEFSCPDYDAVMAFIDAYMKPNISPSDEGDGKSCLEWYPDAKAALEALTETQRNFFLTSDTTAAYAKRYNNWAKAYGEGATSSLGTIMNPNDTAAIIALVALSSATVAAAGFMIASRRRKAK